MRIHVLKELKRVHFSFKKPNSKRSGKDKDK